MADLKTKLNDGDVMQFLGSIENVKRREDAFLVLELMQKLSKENPKMWGKSIIGFGNYHYKYDSGREGDFFRTGLSPRKQSLTIYIMGGFGQHDAILSRLGKYKTGKSCLYINKIEDIRIEVLTELIKASLDYMNKKYPQ